MGLSEDWVQKSERIKIILGDVTKKWLGLNGGDQDYLSTHIDEIYHAAAAIGFSLSLEEARKVNLGGVQEVVRLTKKSRKYKKIHHISSTFIVGDSGSILSEETLDIQQGFNNPYERSKFEAECYLNKERNEKLFINIFRTSILTGRYVDGSIANFKLLYEAVRLFSKEVLDFFPGSRIVRHNIVPVDVAAKAIFLIAETKMPAANYHIISPNTINCFNFLSKAAGYFNYVNPKWIPPSQFNSKIFSPVQLRMIGPFRPFFVYRGKYSAKKTFSVLKKLNFEMPRIDEKYIFRLFNFIEECGYVKKR